MGSYLGFLLTYALICWILAVVIWIRIGRPRDKDLIFYAPIIPPIFVIAVLVVIGLTLLFVSLTLAQDIFDPAPGWVG